VGVVRDFWKCLSVAFFAFVAQSEYDIQDENKDKEYRLLERCGLNALTIAKLRGNTAEI
jgi:hypothetical protein